MAIFARREKPPWLDEARNFCRSAGIPIMGWGPDLLTVEAKSRQRAEQIASQLAQLGFKPIPSEDNAYAGMLDLSPSPEAVQSKIASFDVSRRPLGEQVEPFIWALGFLLLIPGLNPQDRDKYWIGLPLGVLFVVMFFFEASRIWGWRLELLAEGIRVRRRFRWTLIPWDQIQSVESRGGGRNQERVVLKLCSHHSLELGSFYAAFARNMSDRLRRELALHHANEI